MQEVRPPATTGTGKRDGFAGAAPKKPFGRKGIKLHRPEEGVVLAQAVLDVDIKKE